MKTSSLKTMDRSNSR